MLFHRKEKNICAELEESIENSSFSYIAVARATYNDLIRSNSNQPLTSKVDLQKESLSQSANEKNRFGQSSPRFVNYIPANPG